MERSTYRTRDGCWEKGKRLRPERGAKPPSESERGWGPASSEKTDKGKEKGKDT